MSGASVTDERLLSRPTTGSGWCCVRRERPRRRRAAKQRDELAPLHILSSPKLRRRHPNASNECFDRG